MMDASSLSRRARLLDLVTLVGLLLAMTIWVTGGFREWLPWGRVSMTSWSRPLVIALVALLVRHWFEPRPHALSRLVIWQRHWRDAPGVREALTLTLSTRSAVLLVGFLATVLFGPPADAPRAWRLYENEFFNLPARWDTGWYLGIAAEGYSFDPGRPHLQQNIAFFPAYPLLMRYGSLLLGREMAWTGVLISWVSFFAALVYLYRFARDRWGEGAAAAAIGLLACYPFSLYYSTAYTEGLFLLTVIGACYHFERNALWKAGLWGLLAGLTRPNGCLLSVVLACIALRPWWEARGRPGASFGWTSLADRMSVAALPGLGMLIYATYIFFLTGNPFQWAAQNAAWGRVYRGLDELVLEQAGHIGEAGLLSFAGTRSYDALQLSAVVFVALTAWGVYRRIGFPYLVMLAVNLVPPLVMGGLMSIGRVSSMLFPCFLWLALAVPAAHRMAWLAGLAMVQALCAALFFTWRPLF